MSTFKTSYEELRAHCSQVETDKEGLLQESSLLKSTKESNEAQEKERHQHETDKLNLLVQKLQNENELLQ